MSTVRLTAAQALVRYLGAQANEDGERLVAGVWAIFGHGNVAGLGEALHHAGDALPTWRGHNEQGMAHAAIAYAKARNRKRVMAVTSSIGPGATNMVTAAGAGPRQPSAGAAVARGPSLPTGFPTRCCNRWRTSGTAPSAPTTASAR